MALKVNNQADTRQILPIATNGIQPTPFQQHAQAARNGSVQFQSQFGPYNQPTIPVRPGRVPYGAPLPNNRFPTGVQNSLPLFLMNDGSPQGSRQQIQPQAGRTFGGYGPWHVPFVPIKRPLRIFTA